jgi:isoleucyl-tRNA synthetase
MKPLKETLHMPQTDFPMRGNLAASEPARQATWDASNIYDKRLKANQDQKEYVLHDGPPYANGDIHIGHALNKILKDIIVRERNMRGLLTRYVPGWDTHGLPIESALLKNGKIDRKKMSTPEFRKACEAYALTQIENQKQQFKRLGILGEWDQPYLTLTKTYEASQLEVFAAMVEKGLIFKGLKPVFWSPSSETALAEAEIEYQEKKSPSVYVGFKAIDEVIIGRPFEYMIWTTTPWTLPANLAVAVDPEFNYVFVSAGEKCYVIAEGMKETLEAVMGTPLSVLKTVKGKELEHLTYHHPLYAKKGKVVLGHHVTLESGTGLVHIAPGHGEDDFIIGQQYGLEVFCPVDEKGVMTEEALQYQGLFIDDCSKQVAADLDAAGQLVKLVFIHHPYPHDWRTHQPVIFRATAQWFASIDSLKKDMLKAVHEVKWIPSWGEVRMENMIKDRESWCISRQRAWGVPIPVFYAENGDALLDPVLIRHVAELFKAHGSNIWFEWNAEDLLPPGFSHKSSPKGTFTKETDILDVWFDSGTSHKGGMTDYGLPYPADLYIEGSDQYRGWFNSSLSTGIAYQGKSPYQTVVTHGFVLDGDGRKMSKSLGNVIDPVKVMDQKGADILRLWVASVDYQSDVRISEEMLQQVTETYRKIRNTFKFMLGALGDFNPEKDRLDHGHDVVNQYIISRLNEVSQAALDHYETFEFASVIRDINQFVTRDLSAFYLDMAKDVLYIERLNAPHRRRLQTVIYDALNHLVRLLTPLLPHTMDEVYQAFPGTPLENVYLNNFLTPTSQNNEALNAAFSRLLELRDAVLKALEEARTAKAIGKSLEASITLQLTAQDMDVMAILPQPEKFFIVSSVTLEKADAFNVIVAVHPGDKCERCWHHVDHVHEGLCDRCVHVLEDLYGA